MHENRKGLRYGVLINCNLRSDIGTKDTEFLMSNLSKGGCFIKSDLFIPDGETVRLTIELPDCDGTLAVEGEVIWSMKEDGKQKGFGIQFTNISTEDKQSLKEYIEQLVREDFNEFFV